METKKTGLELLREPLEAETWIPVRGFEGKYSVSNNGRIRSEQRTRIGKGGKPVAVSERILRQSRNHEGHMRVNLCVNGERRMFFVHVLVLDAYVCPRPDGLQACHNDGNPANNSVTNLRWDTAKSNQNDRIAHGTSSRGVNNAAARLTETQVRAIRSDSRKHQEIAESYGVNRSTIGLIKSRKTWNSVGDIK